MWAPKGYCLTYPTKQIFLYGMASLLVYAISNFDNAFTRKTLHCDVGYLVSWLYLHSPRII